MEITTRENSEPANDTAKVKESIKMVQAMLVIMNWISRQVREFTSGTMVKAMKVSGRMVSSRGVESSDCLMGLSLMGCGIVDCPWGKESAIILTRVLMMASGRKANRME